MLARVSIKRGGKFSTSPLCEDNLTENWWTIYWAGSSVISIVVVEIKVPPIFPIAIRAAKFIVIVVAVIIVIRIRDVDPKLPTS